MTDLEQRAARLLPSISYGGKSWHEPRAKTLFQLVSNDPLWSLTPHEQADLWFLVWHYRRQIKEAEVVARADELMTGALALRF